MVDRISSGQTTPLRGQGIEKAHGGKEGVKSAKTDALTQRQATSQDGAQLRAHRKDVAAPKKEGQSFFQRHFGKKPLSPQQVKQQERAGRHQRLQKQGALLAQHKKDYTQARSADVRYQQDKKTAQEAAANRVSSEAKQAGGKGTLTGSTRGEGGGKQEVEVDAFKHDEHKLRDKLGALDAFVKHRAEGRTVRFVDPKSSLPQRSALLHEGRRSFFGQAGAKFKNLMLRVFRPQKWQARQVALGEARKTEWAYIKHNHQKILAAEAEQNKKGLQLEKDMEAIHKRSLEDSVEKPQSVPRHLAEKLTYKSDPELLKNPDYVRERVQVLEEIAQKRQETESAALAKTREKLEAQQRTAQQQPSAPSQSQPTAAPQAAPRRQSVQTDL